MVGLMATLKYCKFLPFYFFNGSDVVYSSKLCWGLTILMSIVNSWFSFFPQLLPVEIKMLPSIAKSMVLPHTFCFVQLSWTGDLGKQPVNDTLLIALHGDYSPRKLWTKIVFLSCLCIAMHTGLLVYDCNWCTTIRQSHNAGLLNSMMKLIWLELGLASPGPSHGPGPYSMSCCR